jgi:hypothetical protein
MATAATAKIKTVRTYPKMEMPFPPAMVVAPPVKGEEAMDVAIDVAIDVELEPAEAVPAEPAATTAS